jgi:predicted DNA-binding transcriptional regulator AlpA
LSPEIDPVSTTSTASPPSSLPDRLITTDDIANLTGATPASVRNWIRDRRIPSPIKIGRRYYWRPEQIRDLIGARAEGGAL